MAFTNTSTSQSLVAKRRNNNSSNKMKQSVIIGLVCVGAFALLDSANAMAVTKKTTTKATLSSSSSSSPIPIAAPKVVPPKQTKQLKKKQATKKVIDDDEENEMWMLNQRKVLDAFQELQRSTGSEILNDELQSQIDAAIGKPDMFLDNHVEDASLMEKIAMSSIPQQLPRPAVDALSQKNNKKKKTDAFYSHLRVTPEQEIKLGKLIQRGVALHKLRSDFEEKEGRTITKQEWAGLANCESTKELRRQVSDYRSAKRLLVSANLGLIHAVVNKQYPRLKMSRDSQYDDYIQEGSLGLIRAAELFDPSRGLRFSTYATIWIKGALSNSSMHDTIQIPRREKIKWNKIRAAHQDLIDESGGEYAETEPTVEQIADRAGLLVAEVIATKRKMSLSSRVLSLDYQYSYQSRSGQETSESVAESFLADKKLADYTQMHADVVAALARNLDAREARLVRLRYGLTDGVTRSLAECAEAMGLSRARVHQLDKRCLEKLRKADEADSLQEYLLTIA